MKRLKSIDIFRGLCMAWMILTHLIDWWLKNDYSSINSFTKMIFDPIGASGFLFISGISITLSYRNKIIETSKFNQLNPSIIRNTYILRAFFIFAIAIIYNILISLSLNDLTWIWTWYVLLTTAVSLIITLPLLKTSRIFRISFGFIVMILNQILVSLLLEYEGEANLYGLIFHILYHDIHQDPILTFYPFFLFGTVVGDTIFNVFYTNQNEKIENRVLRYKDLFLLLVIGILFIILGVFISFPKFLNRRTFSWIIYALGIELTLFSVLLIFEILNLINTEKSYKLLFYYSYYSFTLYVSHNLLYFLFLNRLNPINIWFFITATFFAIGLLFRAIYKRWGGILSIKVQISKISKKISLIIYEKTYNNPIRKKFDEGTD
ncbi:MAG: heparan-alpha-glucosaminide N-acetyltransferase domain-containing protein [Promethearchaeota archaeon]